MLEEINDLKKELSNQKSFTFDSFQVMNSKKEIYHIYIFKFEYVIVLNFICHCKFKINTKNRTYKIKLNCGNWNRKNIYNMGKDFYSDDILYQFDRDIDCLQDDISMRWR